ncbi:MAG: ABC transporter substrate-binding protein [Rhodospirillales bacterium]|nr:ABC transporter substrate-binding protein [Rhodospirillales bacterium]
MRLPPAVAFALAMTVAGAFAQDAKAPSHHGIAIHGDVKYPPDFKHFAYVNPDAPKGGHVRLATVGTFDSFNPYTLKGVAAAGLNGVYELLMTGAMDEASAEYGVIVESVQVPEDRSWVAFTLRKEARWSDGRPITPEDVIFSLDILKTKGHPFYRAYFHNLQKAEKIGERTVRIAFEGGMNRELPVITGQLPVLPKHYWEARDFDKTTLEIPVGSGPYRIKSFEAGRSITYERNLNYWGRDVPALKGMNNFDTIRYDYYRDATVLLEAFKAGQFDFRQENSSKDWATGYDAPPVRDGLIKREEIKHERPTGMQGFVFNTRRTLFKDRRVRQALGLVFDFEWTNKNLFYGSYARTTSYFSNSELAATGLPSKEELEILNPFRGQVPDEVFTQEYQPPKTDGSGTIRDSLRKAFELLGQAGWAIKDKKLVNKQTGQPFAFEILLSQANWERIALPYVKNLERLGIEARVRTVDTAQYQKRNDDFDFDMTVEAFGQSLSPGNEQRDFWGSTVADVPGSRNTIGIKDPVVDTLIDLVIAAPDRESLIVRTRALDRVLLWGHYVVPHWHLRATWVAYWDKFGRPETTPKYGVCFGCWWVDAKKAEALDARKAKN